MRECVCVIYLEFFASCSVAEHHPQGTAGIEPSDGALTASQVHGSHSPRMIGRTRTRRRWRRWIAFQTTATTTTRREKQSINQIKHSTPFSLPDFTSSMGGKKRRKNRTWLVSYGRKQITKSKTSSLLTQNKKHPLLSSSLPLVRACV